MNKFKKCLGLFAFLLIFSRGNGQGTECNFHCDCSRPDYHAPIGVMIDHGHPKGEVMVSYRYMNMNMKGNLDGTRSIGDQQVYQMNYLMNANKMSMQMHMLMLMYGLTDRITLMAMVNYLRNSMDMSMMMYGIMNMGNSGSSMSMSDSEMRSVSRTSGFRDVQLYALYTLLEKEKHQMVLSAGLSIPTGSISISGNMMNTIQRLSYGMQIGTGSFSFLPGITYTGQSLLFSWGAQVTSDIKLNNNNAGYKWGNQLVVNSWFAHSWTRWLSSSVRINSDAWGKIKGFDPEIAKYRTTEPGANINNTGGYRASIFAGFNVLVPGGKFSNNRVALEVGVPFYQNLNGIQMNTRAIINAGWQYTF